MSCCTMLLAVLLPVALAALCPCPPPSPENTPVCGSDGRTYSSECQLQCANQPGLYATHSEACTTTEAAAGRRRRYTVEYKDWVKCHKERQCRLSIFGSSRFGSSSCSECGAGEMKCEMMCYWDCSCGCGGLPTGAGLDEDSYDRWYKCYAERRCSSKVDECGKNCHNDEACQDSCDEDYLKCGCGCVQVVLAGSIASPTTSTGLAPTASSTTSSGTDRRDHGVPVRELWDYVLMFVTACACACACACVCACVLARAGVPVTCCTMNITHRSSRGSPDEDQQDPETEMTSK